MPAQRRMPSSGAVPNNPEDLAVMCVDDLTLLLILLVKCADLSHVAAPSATHLAWVRRLEEEVWCQGDMERDLGMLPTGPFDRKSMGLRQMQVRTKDFLA